MQPRFFLTASREIADGDARTSQHSEKKPQGKPSFFEALFQILRMNRGKARSDPQTAYRHSQQQSDRQHV